MLNTINPDNHAFPEEDEVVVARKTLQDYVLAVDPATGNPYRVPLLCVTDPQYARKYAEFAQLAETNPTLAQAILDWK